MLLSISLLMMIANGKSSAVVDTVDQVGEIPDYLCDWNAVDPASLFTTRDIKLPDVNEELGV